MISQSSNLQMKRYLFLWRGLFEDIRSSIESDRSKWMKHYKKVTDKLRTLVDKYNCSLVLISQKNKAHIDEWITFFKEQCKEVEFPTFVVMTVKEKTRYKGASYEAPFLETTEHGCQIGGYADGDDSGKDGSYRKAAQRILNVPDVARKFHFFVTNKEDDSITAKSEGFDSYYVGTRLAFEDVLDKIETKLSGQQIEFYDEQLVELLREPISPEKWQKEISLDNNFTFLRGAKIESEYFHSGIFIQQEKGAEWLGESDANDTEIEWKIACKRKIAADFYECFGANVVKIKLSKQKLVKDVDLNEKKKESFYVMSEILPTLTTYRDGLGSKYDPKNLIPEGKIILKNGRSLDERGLGHILAVAIFINDKEPFGKKGNGIGFLEEDEEGYSKTIKLAPSGMFSEIELEKRVIRVGKEVIQFDSLEAKTRLEFLVSLKKIIDADNAAIEKILNQKGVETYCPSWKAEAEQLAKGLLSRKEKLKSIYEYDLKKIMKLA